MANNTMMKNKGIVFDTSCGISEEEQREIFAQINSIAEKNRLSLAAASADGGIPLSKGTKKKLFKAKKSGGLFPLAVNAAAIAVLAGGFLALYALQGKTNAEVREGAKVYNSAERALIDEIRRETSAADSAQGELNRLSREQTQAATVEAQIGALFANLSRTINDNNLEEAATIIQSTRDFLNTPAFQGLRSIQARKDLYAQSINSFETMVNELRRSQAALASGIMSLDRSAEEVFAQLQEKADQLEQDLKERDRRITEMERNVQASNTEGERAAQNVTVLERRVETLQANAVRQDAIIANYNVFVEQIRNIVQGGKALDDMSHNELRESTARMQSALQSLH